jgi:hypothetical protein
MNRVRMLKQTTLHPPSTRHADTCPSQLGYLFEHSGINLT